MPSRSPRSCKRGERPAGEVIGAERVLEPGVRGAGVDEERVTELAHVAQALERRGVDRRRRGRLEPDVVPERIADDFVGGRGS